MSSQIVRQIAREFGYTHEAITYCLKDEPNLNAGDLLDKLWQLDDGGNIDVTDKYDFTIYSNGSKNKLMEETLLLMFEKLCIKCYKNDRAILSLPCSCYVECKTCVTNICYKCKTPIETKVLVFR